MRSLWRIVRPLMAIVGGILVFCAVGTSDYYVLELGQTEPSSVWTSLWIGLLMMAPTCLHMIRENLKGRR